MASSTLTPYRNSANQVTFDLVTQSKDGATYKVAARDLATPHVVDIQRKLTSASATGNDHVLLRLARTERNATTGKLATLQVLVDISIPKDTSILTQTIQKEAIALMSSLLNDEVAIAATTVNAAALIAGGDL